MIQLFRLDPRLLSSEPYEWAFIDGLFAPDDAAELASSFPRDNFKTITGYDGEKGYAYSARSLVAMGADTPARAEHLSPAWRQLADDLLSPAYRTALALLVGRELDSLIMEANVFHYGPGAWLGPHLDLEDKILTHVFYFNSAWDLQDGGCLTILRSSNLSNPAFEVPPLAGNSVVILRSINSWHAVSPVKGKRDSRRSLAVSFHVPGAVSTLWPPKDQAPLDYYVPTTLDGPVKGLPGPLTKLRRKVMHLVRATARERFRGI